MDLIDVLKEQVKAEKKSIVFPEGTDKRILGAAAKLKKENILNPIPSSLGPCPEKIPVGKFPLGKSSFQNRS